MHAPCRPTLPLPAAERPCGKDDSGSVPVLAVSPPCSTLVCLILVCSTLVCSPAPQVEVYNVAKEMELELLRQYSQVSTHDCLGSAARRSFGTSGAPFDHVHSKRCSQSPCAGPQQLPYGSCCPDPRALMRCCGH